MENIDKEIRNLVSEINSNTDTIVKKIYDAIDLGALEFDGIEKLFMYKLFNAVNEELKKIKEKEINFQDIKGSWWKVLDVHVTDWREFKEYYKYIDDDVFHRPLKDQIYESCRKYGFPMENVFGVEMSSCSFGVTFRYKYVSFGCDFWKPKR